MTLSLGCAKLLLILTTLTFVTQYLLKRSPHAFEQEDIRQDRRGFGGHYLRKHPVRAPYELVGELLTTALQ